MDRLPEAERLLAETARRLETLPQPLMRQGDILRRRARFAEAAQAYDRALARLPAVRAHDWPIFFARGISRERSGNWPGAEADFLRALELAPDQPYVLNYLAFTWADRGENLGRARQMLERAVAQRPQDGNIADSLGWVLFRSGDLAGAIHWLERAVELEPRSATINDHLGDAYWAAGRTNEARFQWRRALGLEPDALDAARIEAKLANGLPATGVPQAARR
jgi:Flp pilus assembly protein TadD